VSDIADTHKLSDLFFRDTGVSLAELEKRGEVYFRVLFGENADHVQGLLDRIHPDASKHTIPLDYAIRF
jgi:hypothetical protein